MKLIMNMDFGIKLKAGDVVEVDAIQFDPSNLGAFKLRVVGVWKKPRWFSICWFMELPEGVPWGLQKAAMRLSGEK